MMKMYTNEEIAQQKKENRTDQHEDHERMSDAASSINDRLMDTN